MNSLLLTLSLAFLVIGSTPVYSKKIHNVETKNELYRFLMATSEKKCINLIENDHKLINVQKALDQSYKCVFDLFDKTTKTVNMTMAKREYHFNQKVYFLSYCAERKSMYKCIDPFLKTLAPCLNLNETKKMINLYNAIKRVLQYVCHKDGERFIEFFRTNATGCAKNNLEDFQLCREDIMEKYFKRNNDTNEIEFNPDDYKEEEQCEDLRELQNCTVTVMGTCSNQKPSTMIDDIFGIIFEELCMPKVSSDAPSDGPSVSFLGFLGAICVVF